MKNRLRVIWFQIGKRSAEGGGFVAVAPWVGTLVGSLFISSNPGSGGWVAAGALTAFAGVLPVAAAGSWDRRSRLNEDRVDGRERELLQVVGELLTVAADVARQQLRKRVEARRSAVGAVLTALSSKMYADFPDLRVSVYGVDDHGGFVVTRDGLIEGVVEGESSRGDALRNELVHGSAGFFVVRGSDPLVDGSMYGGEHATVVGASISSEREVYGALLLETSEGESLGPRDGYILQTFAAVLAVFYGESMRRRS